MNAQGSLGNSLMDMVPLLLAGYVLYGVSLGTVDAPLAAEAPREPEASSIAIAIAGLLIGFERARRNASVRLGLGIFGCAFALTLSGLRFV